MGMRDNDKTILAYEADAQGYVDKTPTQMAGDKKAWVDLALSMIGPTARILELGSGFGRDADYIESQGFTVQRSEAAKSFIKFMEQGGHTPILLNAITEDYGGPYDLIFANAVLLHFTSSETATVMKKTISALAPNGLFAFRLKAGDGSEWDKSMKLPRLMQYWHPDDLKKVVTENGFHVVSFETGHSTYNKFTWLQVIAQKEQTKAP